MTSKGGSKKKKRKRKERLCGSYAVCGSRVGPF